MELIRVFCYLVKRFKIHKLREQNMTLCSMWVWILKKTDLDYFKLLSQSSSGKDEKCRGIFQNNRLT